MARVALTPQEAKRLGLKVPTASRPTRKTAAAKDCLPVCCAICGERADGETAQVKHLAANPTHRRYEAVLQLEGSQP